jgi:hypothetical protein
LLEETLETIADPERHILKAAMESPNLTDDEKVLVRQQYPRTLPEQFRLFMTLGQAFSKQGVLRIGFYDKVVERANDVGFCSYSYATMLTAMCSYSLRRP